MKKFNKLQENSERQSSEIRNKVNEHKELLTKAIEILKKNQMEILDLKNSVSEVKNVEKKIRLNRSGGGRKMA